MNIRIEYIQLEGKMLNFPHRRQFMMEIFPPQFGYDDVLSAKLSRLTPRCGGGIFMSIFSFAYNLAPPGGQTGKVIL